MTLEQFYQKLLNPPKPWKVSKVELAGDGSRVDVWLIHDTYTFLCSECHKEAPTYDHMQLPFYTYSSCPEFGVKRNTAMATSIAANFSAD